MVSPTFMTGGLDPSALSRQAWTSEPMTMDEPLDFNTKPMYTFDTFNNFDSNAMILDQMVINPSGPMMPDWNDPNDLDFSSFIQNPVGA
jgi:hypothetical protein